MSGHDVPSEAMTQLINECYTACVPEHSDSTDSCAESGYRFGHRILAPRWEQATLSWQAIGTVQHALKLLAGALHLRRIALCDSARLKQTAPPFVDLFIQNIITAMLKAWEAEVQARVSMLSPTLLVCHFLIR
jgi:hypothetical protein